MKNVFLMIIIFLTFNGCAINGIANMKDYVNGWVGENLNRYKQAEKNTSASAYVQKWRDNKTNKDYYLPNGNLIHVAPEREGCIIHWEVDKNTNKIIGYKFEGDRCY